MYEIITRILLYGLDVLLGEFFRRDIQHGPVRIFVFYFHPDRMGQVCFSQANPAEDQKRVKRSAPGLVGHCQAG